MLSVAPASVLLIGVLGMFIIAFAVARMTILERKIQRPAPPTSRPAVSLPARASDLHF